MRYSVLFWVWLSSISFLSCKSQQRYSIIGTWAITHGGLSNGYEGIARYHTNRVKFHADTIELASGFFYNTMGLNDSYPQDRFPFVYYGNKEIYRVDKTGLHIFSQPYNFWKSYDIQWLSENRFRLINRIKRDTLLLEKFDKVQKPDECKIKSITADVLKGTLDNSNVSYRVSFTENDLMTYEKTGLETDTRVKKTFKLREGTFKSICAGFGYVDLSRIKKIYPASASEYKSAKFEIEMASGKLIDFIIQDIAADDAPDDLRLAIVPVLFLHQQFVYPKLKPKKFEDQ